MPTFDLSHEPWVPVVYLDGTPGEVGLREALAQAHAIATVETGSPLETVALLRLLQALFVDLFGDDTNSEAAWRAMRARGQFSPVEQARITTYFDDRADAFDLLSETRPFLQNLALDISKPKPPALLFHAEASGNNETLFDHKLDTDPVPITPSVAARGLMASRSYGFSGTAAGPNYTNTTLAPGIVFWMRGTSLFDALLLNTPPSGRARMEMSAPGRPAWDRPPEASTARVPDGYLDYLTFPSRQIRLVWTREADGQTRVTGIVIRQGTALSSRPQDPLMAYRISKKGETYPLKFTPERALWRDSNVLMQLRGMDGGAPQALNWRVNTLGGDHFDLDAFGITNDPRNTAKMLLWRHERIPVFPDVLRDPDRFDTATNALTRAERQASSLNEALLAAAEILAEGSAPRVRDGFDAQARYWARLEGPYFAFLKTLAATDTLAARTYVLAVWTRTLDDTARTAYDEATASLDTTARHLHARVSGRHRLRPAAAYADALKATPSS